MNRFLSLFCKPVKSATPALADLSRQRCPGCGRGPTTFPRHELECPHIDLETARGYLGTIPEMRKNREGWVAHYQRMEGRFRVVCHENNKLRAAMRKAGIIT